MIFLTINDTDIKERNITKTLNQMNLDQDSENNEIILFSTVHESMFESAYLMFKDNKPKEFGVGQNKSIFSYNISIIFIAIIMFYIFEIYWLKRNNFI